jgi:hypothetical protein
MNLTPEAGVMEQHSITDTVLVDPRLVHAALELQRRDPRLRMIQGSSGTAPQLTGLVKLKSNRTAQ